MGQQQREGQEETLFLACPQNEMCSLEFVFIGEIDVTYTNLGFGFGNIFDF